jgi:S1-C subfamily serine protease
MNAFSLYFLAGLVVCGGSMWAADPPRFPAGEAAKHFPLEATPLDRANTAQRTSYADILKLVTPKVVSIFPATLAKPGEDAEDQLLKRFFGGKEKDDDLDERIRGVGSGVIISADGYIVTNSHVVHLPNGKLADEIIVEFSTKRRLPAVIIGSDTRADIALIKVDAKGLPALPMADSTQVEVGDLVFAVGNPFKLGITATMGMVSATRRSGIGVTGADGYETFIQTDAAINPGNSGGALCDAKGRLIGINTAILGPGGNIGIGFAVPVHLARRILFNLLENGEMVRGFVGVRTKSVDDAIAKERKLTEVKGALLEEVQENGPAAKAGLKKGDVVIRIGNEEIEDSSAFRIATGFAAPGAELAVTSIREGKEFPVTLKVQRQESAATSGTTMEITALPGIGLRQEEGKPGGLRVITVEENSPFAKILRAGMVIVEINNTPVTTRDEAAAALKSGANKVQIRQGDSTETLLLKLK